MATSRDWFWRGAGAWDIVCDFIAMAPGSRMHMCWRKFFLEWVLKTLESIFKRLTYTGNGLAGNIDERTDILDLVLLYCCGEVTASQ